MNVSHVSLYLSLSDSSSLYFYFKEGCVVVKEVILDGVMGFGVVLRIYF